MTAPDVWLPLSLAPLVHANDSWLRDRDNQRIRIFGRLAPGVSAGQAQAEMTLLTDRLRPLHDPRGPSAHRDGHCLARTPVAASAHVLPGDPIRRSGSAMSAAAMVLIVACANVGSLQGAGHGPA